MNAQTQLLALLLSVYSFFFGGYQAMMPTLPQDDILALVNKDHPMSAAYKPAVIVPNLPVSKAGAEDNVLLLPIAADAMEALFADALAQGHTLYAVSGYRSFADQSIIYRGKVAQVGEKKASLVVAPPGTSEHQTGLVMDVVGESTRKDGLEESFGASPEGLWVRDNAHRFGFIIRYPQHKTEITGYTWEPWHLRYVGVEVATQIYENDWTLEEYHTQQMIIRLAEFLPDEILEEIGSLNP